MEAGRQRLAELPQMGQQQRQQTEDGATPWVKNMKVIKFTGNMKENIAQLLSGIDCRCGLKKDYSQIINAYGDKITRLRDDRAKYKEGLTQEKLKNQCLQQQLKKTSKTILDLQDSLMTLHSQTVPKEQYMNELQRAQSLEQKCQEIQQGYQMLADQCKELQQELGGWKKGKTKIQKYHEYNDILLDSVQQLTEESKNFDFLHDQNERLRTKLTAYERVERELNMDSCELVQLLTDFASDIPNFSTKEERDLFLLAKKMNSNLWNRKLEMEIKDLHQRRQQVRRLELQMKKRNT